MTLSPAWRTRLFAAAGALLAVVLGVQIASELLLLPLFFAVAFGLMVVMRVQAQPIGTLLLGGALVGYILGNRGFAQLSFFVNLPLFPAELVLLIAGIILLIHGAWRRDLPFRRRLLDASILGWMAISSARLYVDVRTYGAVALRDYAMIYYAAFFFLGQRAGEAATGREFLRRCLLVSCALLLVTYPLFKGFPDFFLNLLVVRGTPLIYYKGDLAGMFMALGAVLFFVRFEERRRWRDLILMLALTAGMVASNSRAAMLGLAAAVLWFAVAGKWRFAAVQVLSGAGAALVLLGVAYAADIPWEKTPLYPLYERFVSLTDPLGAQTYVGEDTVSKGDNNLFRAVWWRAVVEETVENEPWLGLGYGHDLADRFVRAYYPESGGDFTTRSPHNFLLSLFGRTGAVGLAAFLAIVACMATQTWRAIRRGFGVAAGWWCGSWVILVGACFGVVLEGPMGAVIFWTMLGLAAATSSAEVEERAAADEATDALPVPDGSSAPLPASVR